jgi:hypothetical protein
MPPLIVQLVRIGLTAYQDTNRLQRLRLRCVVRRYPLGSAPDAVADFPTVEFELDEIRLGATGAGAPVFCAVNDGATTGPSVRERGVAMVCPS